MRKILLLISFLFSTTVLADVLTWDQLETANTYSLANDIEFAEGLTLKAGSSLYFNELITGQVPVIIFSFSDPNCKDASFESEIILFNPEPEDTDHNKEIGLQYSECSFDVYVEPQYYYGKSIFKN
ncbi:MAG: hypothetical protein NDI63_08255 [Pseudobdellovibrio sp.]|nr:hypothetical protein [Pseudobdellovibrio sp.]